MNPEGYNTSAHNAAALREIADQIEKRQDWQKVHVQVWYRRPDEIKNRMLAKARSLAKGHQKIVLVEFPDGTSEEVVP